MNLTNRAIGNISAACSAFGLLGVPMLCYLFDRFKHQQHRCFAALIALDAALHAGRFFLPSAARALILPEWLPTWAVLALPALVTSEVVHSATYHVLDALTLKLLSDKLDYGRVRLWAGLAVLRHLAGSAEQSSLHHFVIYMWVLPR